MNVALLALAAVVVVVVVVLVRRRRQPDTVASFRRQIDALSSEARRPVVDQVTQIDRDPDPPAADGDDPTPGGTPTDDADH